MPQISVLLCQNWRSKEDWEKIGSKHSIVHFRFEEVTDVEFDGFNHQNVLDCLEFTLVQTKEKMTTLGVELVHCFGLSGGFKALRARIVSVSPYLEPDS